MVTLQQQRNGLIDEIKADMSAGLTNGGKIELLDKLTVKPDYTKWILRKIDSAS